MVDTPDLFLLIEAPVLGELGPGTDCQFDVVCDSCKLREPRHERIELILDKWKDQHLFDIGGLTFVSEELRTALAEAGSTGAEFQAVDAAKFKGRSKLTLPSFHLLDVTGRAEGPDDWWEHISTCEVCGGEKWFPTAEGMRSEIGPSLTGTGEDAVDPLPLRVYDDSWTGDDIFDLQSISATVVTSRFVEIAQGVGIPGVFLRPTEFVTRSDAS